MAKDTKFGTFGGVFTPSILTILGVIMYLRLPRVVGEAGLMAAGGIILVAHVISICTGLSISSIATDKSVGAGGPYYIVSRSLGLPIGGTLGLALFVGLSFSISLYIIGFSESFLSYFGWEITNDNIRVCGTVVMLALTAVTLISTALAIKTQYLIMGLIALSLVSIGAGSAPSVPATPHLQPQEGGASLAVLFGIFFPAVTGFTAGVNMSGDLKDPRRSIPVGTMASIVVGAVVYFCLAAFLAFRVPADILANDPNVLLTIAWIPVAVVAGIWGATLSSALGSILGAPRILQAVSGDQITPRFFAKGYGPSNEPRNALIMAFLIGEGGILIAELDAIARIVSMVFLATYGFLNLSSFIESWASPDFRPDFKIPKTISLVGAITCVVVMIQLDLLAMVGATVVMAALFAYLQRRQLKLESGDTWEGIWSSLVRAGLHRLSREKGQQRNWRPNILMFSATEDANRGPLTELAASLISGNGVYTDFELVERGAEGVQHAVATDEEPPALGVFHRQVRRDDRWETVSNVCRYHGFSGLEPNTVLLGWDAHGDDPDRLIELLDLLYQLDLNVLLFAPAEIGMGTQQRIDVWWAPSGGNLPFALSLVRFLTAGRAWHGTDIRILMVTQDSTASDSLRAAARRVLTEMRVEATIRVIDNSLAAHTYLDWVRDESADADLTITGLPRLDPELLGDIDQLQRDLPTVLVMRAAQSFPQAIKSGRDPTGSVAALEHDGEDDLTQVELPAPAELARIAEEQTNRFDRLVRILADDGLARVYGHETELIKKIHDLVARHFSMLEKGLTGSNLRRHRNVVNRVQSSYLWEARHALQSYEDEALTDQRATIEGRIDGFLGDYAFVQGDEDSVIWLPRPADDFRARDDDPPTLRRLKRQRRFRAWLTRREPTYRIPFADLNAYYFQRGIRELLRDSLQQFETDSYQLAVQVGKVTNSSKASLTLLGEGLGPDESTSDFLTVQRAAAVARLDELVGLAEKRSREQHRHILERSRHLMQAYVDDMDRIDVGELVRTQRKLPTDEVAVREQLLALSGRWNANQSHLLGRAKLGLLLSAFHHRLASTTNKAKETITLQIRNGTLSECDALLDALREYLTRLEDADSEEQPALKITLDVKSQFDPKEIIEGLVQEVSPSVAELPETFDTVTDATIMALEEGVRTEAEPLSLAVRRLVQFVFETEFIGELQTHLETVPQLEQRAGAVAQDTVRLVTFNLAEYDHQDEEEQEATHTQLADTIRSGIDRIEKETEDLRNLLPATQRILDSQLTVVIESTDAFELTSSSDRLEQHIRVHQRDKAVRDARGFARRGAARIRDAMVNLLYRRSAGVLLARKLRSRQTRTGSTIVDRVLALTNEQRPRPDVLDGLPFYYRQLFFGQSAMGDSFWVDREDELSRARKAIGNFRRGSHGALVVVGDRGSGKSALTQRIAAKLLERRSAYRILPVSGGSIDAPTFKRAFEAATDARGSYDQIFKSLPERAAVVIDDLELWWERSDRGMRIVDEILDLIETHGHRCLFVLACNTHGFDLINRFRSVSDDALTVLRCEPLPAEQLKSVITLRHGSTGVNFSFGGRDEDALSPWRLARLFSSHFDYSGGNVGVALRSWVTHMEKASDEHIVVRQPETHDWDVLDELRVEWVALLVQLVLHKQLTTARLERTTGLPRRELRREIDTLIRMGLVTEARNGVIEIDRFIDHILAERFVRQGVLR